MSEEVSTPLEEDVTENNEIEEQEQVVEDQVEEQSTEESTTDSDYDKAWENIDLDNPSEGLFGETTVESESTPGVEDQNIEVLDDQSQVSQSGLMITNPILKYKGRDIPIDTEEELINLAQKGFKLESEMTKIKPYKQIIAMLDSASVDTEDIKAFTDAMLGNEGAKSYVSKKLGLQSTSEATSFFDEVDDQKQTEDNYKPEVPETDAVADYFRDITENQPEIAGKVSQVYADIDDEFKNEVYHAKVFPMFVQSIASGEFDELYPIAIKIKHSNPLMPWIDAYQKASGQINGSKTKPDIPPIGTKIPRQGSGNTRITGDDYDRAFGMDRKELEDRIFG